MKPTPTCVLLVGPPGSGKTAWAMARKAEDATVQVISSDDYFRNSDGTLDIDPTRIISDMTLAHKECRNRFRRIVGRGQEVIVDNFNATKEHRDYYVKYARKSGYQVMIVALEYDQDECALRAGHRGMLPDTFDRLVASIDILPGVYVLPAFVSPV